MLRALTVILVVIGIAFIAWSMLVMTGGRDWLATTMTAETSKPEKAPASEMAANEAKPEGAASEAAPAKDESAASDTAPAEQAKDESAAPEAAPAEEAKDEGAEKPTGEAAASADGGGSPLETAKSGEKGSLKSPYADNYKSVAEEGHKKFMAAGCNGCHGGTGGGGMGPPLTNVWVYGDDGDTLFRLIALGTDEFQKQGYTRKGSENVVGPMPPMGGIVKSNDDLWKIIAWIWSINPPKSAAAAPSE
jgi:mono/diheme cytochrome c family protein